MKKTKMNKFYSLSGLCLLWLSLIACQLSGINTSYEKTLAALDEQNQNLSTKVARQDEIITYLATRIGVVNIPSLDPHPTRTPYYPISGSVELEEGACCAGGTAGDTITVEAAFEAESPFGRITEMRSLAAGYRLAENELQEATWENFTSRRDYEVRLSSNWVGYYVCVQYRDEASNISPVYCDDISLEGHPPSP